MTKALVIAALTLASASAFASKARQTALQNAKTVAWDVQDIFTNPAKATGLGSLVTVEFGGAADFTAANTTSNFAQTAEGGFLRADDDKVWGLYLGRKSYDNWALKAMTGSTYLEQTNPIELIYGSKMGAGAWGVSLNYSNGKDETADSKNTAYGIRLGYVADVWNAFANVGLSSTATSGTTQDYKGDLSAKVGGEYDWNDMKFYGHYFKASGKNDLGGGTEVKGTIETSELGVEHKLKSDVAHFFYGAKWATTNRKTETPDHHLDMWSLPLYAGIEADAASWLVARFALSQSLFNAQEGAEFTTGTFGRVDKTGYTDTAASLGVGLKFAKLTVDGVLSAGNTGYLNFNDGNGANAFMSQVSATYFF